VKALVVRAPGAVSVETVDSPVPAEHDVMVAPLLSGMCGTDIELIDGNVDPMYVRYPLILGHEWVGVLRGDVPGVAVAGDRVVVEGIIPCDVCADCLHGDTNRCATYDEIGFTRPGGIAELVAVPSRLVHRIDPAVANDDAAFIEPMSVVWRALTRIPLRAGLKVAIVGDGTIALLAAHLIRRMSPGHVVVIGLREAQRDLAMNAGADAFVTEIPAQHFDVVIEAAGTGPAVRTAISLAARGAMIILLGLPAHGTTIDVSPEDLVNNDQILQGSFGYTRSAWVQVVEKVNAGELKPSFLITHRFSLDESEQAITALRGGVGEYEPRGKVVIAVTPRH
jgi:2-desacetyl-2-hydroxyethyl bacteriochlorophyllide A dehydrogenase